MRPCTTSRTTFPTPSAPFSPASPSSPSSPVDREPQTSAVATPEQAKRRHDEILQIPAAQRVGHLLKLLADLERFDGADKVCLHQEIMICSLSLPSTDEELLHVPLMELLASAHADLGKDAREDVAQNFADIMLIGATTRDDVFGIRLLCRLLHLAQNMDAERLAVKCVSKIIGMVNIRNEQRRAELIGQAAPAAAFVIPPVRIGYLEQLYDAKPKDPAYRLAVVEAIAQQLDTLPTNSATMAFKGTVLQEQFRLRIEQADTALAADKLASLSLQTPAPAGSH